MIFFLYKIHIITDSTCKNERHHLMSIFAAFGVAFGLIFSIIEI